jgi:hypothetical protein
VSYPKEVATASARHLLWLVGATALLACVLAGGAMIWLVRTLTRPLRTSATPSMAWPAATPTCM